MPIQFPDFQRITFDQANPGLVGAERGQKMAQSMQDYLAKMLANKYYGPNIESEIGLRGAESSLMGSEQAKNVFLTSHPQYINPEGMIMSQALGQQGGGGGGGGGAPIQPGSQGPGTQGSGANSGMSYDAQGNNIVGSQQDIDNIGNRGNQSPGGPSQLAPAIAATKQGGQQFSPSQYSSDALAFNPPALPSPTGNPASDNLYFKKFGIPPLVQAKMDLAQKQAEKYQTENIERNKQFNTESQFANQSTIDAHKFLDALQRTSALERGAAGGRSPAVRDAAQEMDAYGNSMAASATKLFQGNNAVHQSDIELNQLAKPNRKQNKDVAFDLAQGVIAKNDRMKERQQFYSRGTQMGLKPEVMDAMWNKFETDRPYINPETKTPNDAYKGTSSDYLHPEMVNSFLNGNTYNLPNQKQLDAANWNAQDLKSVTSWAKKNGLRAEAFSKQNLYDLAAKEKIPLSQLKTEFQKMGAL